MVAPRSIFAWAASPKRIRLAGIWVLLLQKKRCGDWRRIDSQRWWKPQSQAGRSGGGQARPPRREGASLLLNRELLAPVAGSLGQCQLEHPVLVAGGRLRVVHIVLKGEGAILLAVVALAVESVLAPLLLFLLQLG